MGQFDIKYSEALPTGQSGSVRAGLNVDTGTGAIAESIQYAGKVGMQKYEEIRNAEERLQISAGQRQIKERIIAAQNSVTGDEDEDNKLWALAEGDISKIKYKSQRVNSALQLYNDDIIPVAKNDFTTKHLGMKAKNIHDSYETQGQGLLATGDLVGYQDLLDARLDSKDITPAMHKSLSDSALSTSLLEQARDLVSSDRAGDKQRGIGILKNMQGIEGINMSTEQKEDQQKLLKLATKASSEQSDAAITDAVVSMYNMRKASALEKAAAGPKIIQAMLDGGVTGDNINQYVDIVNKWAGEDEDPTVLRDEKVLAQLRQLVNISPELIDPKRDIWPLVGLGKNGGITSADAKELANSLQDIPPMQKEIAARKQHELTALYNDEDLTLEAYNDLANRLTVYTNTNTDFTPEEMDKFFNGLVQEKTKLKWYVKAGMVLPPIFSLMALSAHQKTKGVLGETIKEADASISRITRIREKIMTDRVIDRQLRTVGVQRKRKDGKTWRLIERGETPKGDVWEVVE